jgi:hypothetical protein
MSSRAKSFSFVPWIGLMCAAAALPIAAQEIGTASGRGTIISGPAQPDSKEQTVSFAPRYAFAYVEGKGADRFTWIVLTEKEPPLKAWAGSKDRVAARQQWCQKEKAGFVAVKIDAEQKPDLYFLCPPGAAMSNTEMVSSANGLKSVEVQFTQKDAKRLKGRLRGGVGNCPTADGVSAYCEQTSDYTFDAPMLP